MIQKQSGFSILEIFISLTIGLVLVGGVLSVFVGMRTTTAETSSYGEMAENGRFAISILSEDIAKVSFFGRLNAPLDFSVLRATPTAADISTDCTGAGVNNATFPVAAGQFRTLWGDNLTSASAMGCISDAKSNSDLIQLKRTIAAPIAVPDPAAAVGDADRFYLLTNTNAGEIFAGNTVPTNIATIEDAQIWQYQHHIYYVAEETQGTNKVPVLKHGRLTANGIDFDVLVDGIEAIRFMYGIDTDVDADTTDYFLGDGDGIVDTFIAAEDMTENIWSNNNSRILAIKIYVLARDILPDPNYTNNNTYILGNNNAGEIKIEGGGDNYRRLLFTSTVSLDNVREDVWPR